MKKIIALVVFTFLTNIVYAVETQKVCHEKKGKQVCKIVKIHKSLANVTKVPVKKK